MQKSLPVVLSKESCDSAMLVLQRASVDLGRVSCEHYFRVLQARPEKLSRRCTRAFGMASKALLGMHCTLE